MKQTRILVPILLAILLMASILYNIFLRNERNVYEKLARDLQDVVLIQSDTNLILNQIMKYKKEVIKLEQEIFEKDSIINLLQSDTPARSDL